MAATPLRSVRRRDDYDSPELFTLGPAAPMSYGRKDSVMADEGVTDGWRRIKDLALGKIKGLGVKW